MPRICDDTVICIGEICDLMSRLGGDDIQKWLGKYVRKYNLFISGLLPSFLLL